MCWLTLDIGRCLDQYYSSTCYLPFYFTPFLTLPTSISYTLFFSLSEIYTYVLRKRQFTNEFLRRKRLFELQSQPFLDLVCVLLIPDLVVIEITARLYGYRKECLAFCCVGLSIVDTTPSVCVGGGRNMVHNKWTIVLSMNGCPQKIYHLKTFKLSHKHF